MSSAFDAVLPALRTRAQAGMLHSLMRLPAPALRRIAGPPIRIDGQELSTDAQALLRLQGLAGQNRMAADTPAKARAAMRHGIEVLQQAPVPGVEVSEKNIPATGGDIGARLYRPETSTAPGTLMVFYHGGGFVLGDLESHDGICRFLARYADIRILSVDYRLAPEHPFPAGLEDAIDAYRYALDHAEELGSTPDSLAVGGDSAGGNFAAAVAQHAASTGIKSPVLQFLLYPAVDATNRRRSRELFGNGFLLTDTDMDWFMDQYQPDIAGRTDPRLSVLLADDLSGLAPAYVVTAGFDPLRDEGEEYVGKLTEAGVPVVHRRFPDLMHGFANLFGVGGRFREAMFEMTGSLRATLTMHGHNGS